MHRYDNAEDDAKIKDLNAAVASAMEARRDWLDSKAEEYGDAKVGEDIYDLDTGRYLGRVTAIKRFHRDGNQFYDTSLSFYLEYCTNPDDRIGCKCIDNTSRQHISVGNKAELIRHQEYKLEAFKRRNTHNAPQGGRGRG